MFFKNIREGPPRPKINITLLEEERGRKEGREEEGKGGRERGGRKGARREEGGRGKEREGGREEGKGK